MKDNRKNRKLIWIRERNKLRSGLFRIGTQGKISNQFIYDIENSLDIRLNFIRQTHEGLINEYKQKYRFNKFKVWGMDFKTGTNNDDFIKNCHSFIYRLNIMINTKNK